MITRRSFLGRTSAVGAVLHALMAAPARAVAGDPVLGVNLGNFRAQMTAMIRRHRHDQTLRRFNEAICSEFLVPFRVILSREPDA